MSGRQWLDSAGAPPAWTALATPSASGTIRLAFRDVPDRLVLASQLERWRAVLARTQADILVLPDIVFDGSLPVLSYPTPLAVGSNLPAPHTLDDTIARLGSIADALDVLHESGAVHGALAHYSLWWCADGKLRFPDAGLANALDGIVPASAEASAYRAPEFWHGQSRTRFSDQYALAVMAYEWITGHLRTVEQSEEGVMALAPLMLEPAALRAAGAPIGLADVLQRALSSSPTARFESCRAFVDALAARVKAPPSPERVERRKVVRWGGVALFVPSWTTVVRAAAVLSVVYLVTSNLANLQRVASLSWLQRVVPRTRVESSARPASSQPGAPGVMSRGVLRNQAGDKSTPAAAAAQPGRPADAPARGTMQRGALANAERPTTVVDVNAAALDVPRLLDRAVSPTGDRTTAAREPKSTDANGGNPLPGTSRDASKPPRSPMLMVSEVNAAVASGTPRRVDAKQPAIILLSVPANGRVYVDGVLVRDKKYLEVVPGTHDINVLLPGGASLQRRVSLAAGDTVAVRLAVPSP